MAESYDRKGIVGPIRHTAEWIVNFKMLFLEGGSNLVVLYKNKTSYTFPLIKPTFWKCH